MGEYLHTTRESTLDNMRPALAAAIRTRIEQHELGEVETSALMCCETISTKQKKGLFGGKAEVLLVGLLLTPQWLIWAAGKETEAPVARSARLRDLQVQDYEKSEMYKLVPDTGIEVSGLRTDTPETGSIFIGLGPEPAAQKLRALLKQAIAKT